VEQSKDTGASARAGLFVCSKCGEKVRDPQKRGFVGWVGWTVLGILAYVAFVFATADITTRAFVCAESVIIAASVVLYLLFSRKEYVCPRCGRTNCLAPADNSEGNVFN